MAEHGAIDQESITAKFIPDSELRRIEEDKILADRPKPEALTSLAAHVRSIWETNKKAKNDTEQRGLSILRMLKGEYEPSKLAALTAAKMPTDFIRLASNKARDCESWTMSAFNLSGDRTWDIVPEDDHALPPDVEDIIRQNVRTQIMRQAMLQSMQTQQPVDPDMLMFQIEQQEMEVKQQVMK